jgi:hypothetical protein
MLASVAFGVNRSVGEDWFDTILDVDTKLFVDPFLIFKEVAGRWAGAHETIIAHFDRAFMLVAEGNLDGSTLAYRKAVDILVAPEPRELCLGYTSQGTGGAGSAAGYARLMAAAIADAISRGLEHPRHFEELGIINKGIGADRISDITCTILKPRLVDYTQEIASRHGIPTAPHRIYAAEFDEHRQRFRVARAVVPTNPVNGDPLLLVPQRFLDQLPTLNADDWWTHYENEQLRQDLNYEVMGRVDKATIVSTARRHLDQVREYAEAKEGEAGRPYEFDRDPAGVVGWENAANEFTAANPLQLGLPQSSTDFDALIELIIGKFRLFVEKQGGWYLLWDGGNEKHEQAPQLVFYGIARNYCEANNIAIDREVNLGRGPVDFKFSNGYVHRVHLEVKKVHSSKFWNGLERQLPSYLSSDEVQKGWFLAVRYRSGRSWDQRVADLPQRVQDAAARHGRELRCAVVDARQPSSPSKL